MTGGGGALLLVEALIALGAALWAGLLSLGEEAAVGETAHTMADAPPVARVPLHRGLHVARLALLVLAAVAGASALSWWTRGPMGGLVSVAVATGFLFVVGDALPRSLASLAPELAAAILPLAHRSLAVFDFLLAFLGWADRGLHGLVHLPRPASPVLGGAQRDMLLGVFMMADTTVDEVMTPRLDLVGIDVSAPYDELLRVFKESGHTRLPVFDGSPDAVLGVVFAKDLVPIALGLKPRPDEWRELVRSVAYVPEAKVLDAQLHDFQRGRAHIAIVVDEFGGTSGIVTLEDILEEIVGEIRDDPATEPPSIEQDGDRYWVHGGVGLDQLSQTLGADFHNAEVSTVGGLIYSVLGRVPRSGEELHLDGFRVVVERVDRRRVTRVYFERE
ncbi:MAG TPA: hemolysin family protein [Gemmatimonadales bacterium]|nr:hemolysin family protein [Gemmatimonadales bacterium]